MKVSDKTGYPIGLILTIPKTHDDVLSNLSTMRSASESHVLMSPMGKSLEQSSFNITHCTFLDVINIVEKQQRDIEALKNQIRELQK